MPLALVTMRRADPRAGSLLRVAIAAARAAGTVLLGLRERPCVEGFDASGVLRTKADRDAEGAILEVIQREYPDGKILKGHDIIAEESGYHRRRRTTGTWIIDPLDGTRNYIAGSAAWGTIIAFARGNQIDIGVIFLPGKNLLLSARRGGGVWLNGERLRPPQSTSVRPVLLYDTYGDRERARAEKDRRLYGNLVGDVQESRCSADAFLKLLLGSAHALIEYIATPWDDAAGALMVRELGGTVTDLTGRPWTPSLVAAHAREGIIADATGTHWALRTPTLMATLNKKLGSRIRDQIQDFSS